MDDRTNELDNKQDDAPIPDERPATPKEDDVKTGMHRPGTDPRKQIPAREGGQT